MAYGGDFNNYDPSDANFCANGVIAPTAPSTLTLTR